MHRRAVIGLLAAGTLAACSPPPPQLGPDGKPLPRVYRITNRNRVTFDMLDGVNALREAAGIAPLSLNAELTAAAATHALDMSRQNRPWHFGSDGSSPLQRVARTGYTGRFKGELISETYETELETLAAWMEEPSTRNVILDPEARDMGFSWYQEDSGRLWWVMNTGAPAQAAQIQS